MDCCAFAKEKGTRRTIKIRQLGRGIRQPIHSINKNLVAKIHRAANINLKVK
jgi:hypothetical protein